MVIVEEARNQIVGNMNKYVINPVYNIFNI